MELVENKIVNKKKHSNSVLSKIGNALRNRTFLYILKRVLSSLLTLLLLIVLITALLRCLPDTKFYSMADYNLIRAKSGEDVANRWRSIELYKYGILDAKGNRISIIQSIGVYIYNILPIWKKIPITWKSDYSEPIKYWEGFCYFGKSIQTNEYVLDAFFKRIPISFTVSIISIVLAYLFALPLGIAMAKKPGGFWDKVGNVFIVLNYAIPALVFYLIMNTVCGMKSGPFGWANFGFFYDKDNPVVTLIPPIFCISFLSIPGISIWVRRFMTDELSSDYVKFARSKGISENKIMTKHVFRNAVVPLVRDIPATLLFAMVGSYYVETIWKIPGTGKLLVNALQGASPDIAVIQGLTLIYGAISMLAFLLGDVVTVFCDPRIKLMD